jgi:uncharacterized coiled-coil DUF342 family protein
MNDKELYTQKFSAQLDEWKAEADKLRARSKGASADMQLSMNKLLADLEDKIGAASAKLSDLSTASESAWDSLKKNVEEAWDGLKVSLHEAVAKFKE